MTEEFVKELSKLKKLCPHFHLSLQSGSDTTLKRMNRKYTTKEYLRSVETIRSFFDQPAITTDIIVGFPMETEEEFRETLAFAEKAAFSQIHIFKYSRRKGTAADRMQGQLTEEIKTERSNRLFAVEEKLSQEYRMKFSGKTEEVLLEEEVQISDVTYVTGHTTRYIKTAVKKKDGEDITGKTLPVRLTGTMVSDAVLAELEP